jgi:hypothetical protein
MQSNYGPTQNILGPVKGQGIRLRDFLYDEFWGFFPSCLAKCNLVITKINKQVTLTKKRKTKCNERNI